MRDMYDRGAILVENATARAAYLTQGQQWIALDTPQTLVLKLRAAQRMGIGGSMVSSRQLWHSH